MGDYLEYVACIICTQVGEKMKADEAMLLPNIQRHIIQEIHGHIALFSSIVHVSADNIPTTRWLLSHLHLHFNARLEVHKRYGTLLYHKSCDLVQALSTTLGKSEAKTTCRSCSEHEVQQHTVPTIKEQLQTVSLNMNTKLQARMLRGSFDASPESIASLNLRDAWDNTDPKLRINPFIPNDTGSMIYQAKTF